VSDDSAAGRVTRSLRQRMLTGEITPGTHLSQSRVAAEHGVSRIPVRDALRVLAGEGLVDLRPGHAIVRGLSVAELQELYEMRESIEPVVTRIAVPNVGRAQVAQMSDLADTMESTSSPAEWIAANARFHALVYRCAPRPRMVELTEQLRRLADRYLYLHLSVIGSTEHLREEHRLILDAVRRGDAAATAELTLTHLVTSHDFILRYLLDNHLMPLGQDADGAPEDGDGARLASASVSPHPTA
jgi:DNA-binding GntR family transcriptional regulator